MGAKRKDVELKIILRRIRTFSLYLSFYVFLVRAYHAVTKSLDFLI